VQQLKDDIADLKRYKADQEAQVSQALEMWNDQLKAVSQEINLAYEERDSLLRENLKLRSESRMILEVLADVHAHVLIEQEKLERAKALYESSVSKWRIEIAYERQTLLSIRN
jgi:hypothetical protein